jgi:hypothetical protein
MRPQLTVLPQGFLVLLGSNFYPVRAIIEYRARVAD